MLYEKEIQPTPKNTSVLQTEVRHIEEGFTLLTVLLETQTPERTFFSVAVTIFSADRTVTDAKLIDDITGDRAVAQSLFRLITDGSVTPCTLSDVLEDQL